MIPSECKILTIAPYHILPVNSGGRAAIVSLHDAIGKQCTDHVISTNNNADNKKYHFHLHKLFINKPTRYIPYYSLSSLIDFAQKHAITHIICEHPYMAISAIALAKRLNIKWYLRSHNIESERFKALGKSWAPILRKYEKYAMQKADGIFFITQEDSMWAQKYFSIKEKKCYTIPFGTAMSEPPAKNENKKIELAQSIDISTNIPWLYFLGALDYPPNYNAVEYILNEVTPRLDKKGIQYQLLIAGQGLPDALQQQITAKESAHYLGFVDDLHQLINSSDIMLNPVLTGGGIKTKAIEALGYSKTVVSSKSGAAGIRAEICDDKLLIAEDNDWDKFALLTENAMNSDNEIPQSFYNTYNNDNIAKKVLEILCNG